MVFLSCMQNSSQDNRLQRDFLWDPEWFLASFYNFRRKKKVNHWASLQELILGPSQAFSVKELIMKYDSFVFLWILQNCETLSCEFFRDCDTLLNSDLWKLHLFLHMLVLHFHFTSHLWILLEGPTVCIPGITLPVTVTLKCSANSASVCTHLLFSDQGLALW